MTFLDVIHEISSSRQTVEVIAILSNRINRIGGCVLFENNKGKQSLHIYNYNSDVSHITSSYIITKDNEQDVFQKLVSLYIELKEIKNERNRYQ